MNGVLVRLGLDSLYYTNVCMYECMYVCMHVCRYIPTVYICYVCIHVFNVRMYVCTFVCMCIYMCTV